MQLRNYQNDSIQALYSYFEENATGHPILVLPTAAGKSVIAGEFIRGLMQTWPGQRVLLLTHVKELIAQNYEKLMTLWPDAPAGIYSAGLNRRDTDHDIIFAGIQSVHKRATEIGHIDLIIIDECHLVPKSGMGMYLRFLKTMNVINSKIRVVGLTATPYRLNSGSLIDGDDRIFTDIAYDVDVMQLVNDGYLSPLVPKAMDNEFDLSEINTRAGDYKTDQLHALTDNDALARMVLVEILAYGRQRKSWLIFCTGVNHAEKMAQIIAEHGITTATITGATPPDVRDTILELFKSGHIQCLTNCDVLTTGFDAPAIDMLVFLRPTQSQGLYVQMCGRGMRLAENKKDCLVLDFGGNTQRHGPINALKPQGEQKAKGSKATPPSRTCPVCKTIMAASCTKCPDCGHRFPRDITHDHTASTAALLVDFSLPVFKKHEWHDVHDITLERHKKQGKPDSVRVSYHTSQGKFLTWVCPEHGGYAADKAKEWVSLHYPHYENDLDTDFILNCTKHLEQPKSIRVKESEKYPNITRYDFSEYREEIPF
jgi:DNA repair protein RadD